MPGALGSSACRRAPRRGRAGRAARCRRAFAPPRPSSATSTTTRPLSRVTAIRHVRGLGVLDDVREALRPRRSRRPISTVSGRRSAGIAVTRTGIAARRASVSTAAESPCSVRIGGCSPRASARSSSSAPASSASIASSCSSSSSRCSALRGEAQREPDREQALLRAVVEVALDPPALGVGRRHDPRPRVAHDQQLRAQLGLQPRVLERQPRRRADARPRARGPRAATGRSSARPAARRRARSPYVAGQCPRPARAGWPSAST